MKTDDHLYTISRTEFAKEIGKISHTKERILYNIKRTKDPKIKQRWMDKLKNLIQANT